MKSEEEQRPLTAEEVAELRAMLLGRRSMNWLFANARGVAVWFLAIAGAWAVLNERVADWVLGITRGQP